MQIIRNGILLFAAVAFTGCSNNVSDVNPQTDGNYTVIKGATLLSMVSEDHQYKAGSLLILREGKIHQIVEDGTLPQEVKQARDTRYLDLTGKTVLPGFIEPHGHLALSSQMSFVADLSPCLPQPYQVMLEQDFPSRKTCSNFLEPTLAHLKSDGPAANWYLGNGLDPSRMRWSETDAGISGSKAFMRNPAEKLKEFDKPLFILDQSGHLAYVNQRAFHQLPFCKTKDHKFRCQGDRAYMVKLRDQAKDELGFNDGDWGISCLQDATTGKEQCQFSGLLKEESSYGPFLSLIRADLATALQHHEPKVDFTQVQIDKMRQFAEIYSRAGVTTFVEGGGSSEAMLNAYRQLYPAGAPYTPGIQPPMRVRMLFTWNAKALEGDYQPDQPATWFKKIPWSKADDGMFSAEGIKLWADGSTQGCSADLQQAYVGNDDALCQDYGKGHQNYDAEHINTNLAPFFRDSWYINIHANGDKAILNSVDALSALAARYPQGSALPHTLIHATVNEGMIAPPGERATLKEIISARNTTLPHLSTSHLIGHVAYWGMAMKNELGEQRARLINPARSEWELGIPVSLHSDTPISPLYPLWFVQQAVTRNTWEYPYLKDSERQVLNAKETLTPYQALMAITINPARQHRLDDKVGSLEVGKVADLVVLDSNPLTTPHQNIRNIKVACTLINGRVSQWSPPAQCGQLTLAEGGKRRTL